MLRARVTVAVALASAVAGTACTLISGVEGYEIRRVVPATDGDGSSPPVDGAPGSDGGGDGGIGAPVPCATPLECQEERCRSDLPNPRLAPQIGKVLGVTATCTAGVPFVINPGPQHYYGADVRCTLVPQPTPTAVSNFRPDMEADGWYGYSTKQEGGETVVIGQSTTRVCSSY